MQILKLFLSNIWNYSIPNWLINLSIVTKYACLVSLPTSILLKINTWTLSNQDFILSVLVCIAIDHVVGSIYHAFNLRDFSFKKNARGLILKLSLCAMSVILFETIHDTVKNIDFVYHYLKTTTRLIVILYPISSAFVNMNFITNGKFPPTGWINKLKKFNENIEVDQLK